jgi:hypothetical protein
LWFNASAHRTADREAVTESTTSRPRAIPGPLGLSQYIQGLGEWARERPLTEPLIHGLVKHVAFDASERERFLAGEAGLFRLVPPIQPQDVVEADLDRDAMIALFYALLLRATHALLAEPGGGLSPVIRDTGELLSIIELQLGGDVPTAVLTRLEKLKVELAVRGATVGKLDERQAAIIQDARRKRAEDALKAATEAPLPPEPPAERAVGRIPFWAVLWLLGTFALSAGLWKLETHLLQGPPPAAAYTELAVLGIIRVHDRVSVRVDASVFALPEAERMAGAKRLFERFRAESEGEVTVLVLQDALGTNRYRVTASGMTPIAP